MFYVIVYASATSPVSHNLLPSGDQVKVWFRVMDGEERQTISVRVARDFDIDDFVKVALETVKLQDISPDMVSVKIQEGETLKDVKKSLLVSALTTNTEDKPLLLKCPVEEGVYWSTCTVEYCQSAPPCYTRTMSYVNRKTFLSGSPHIDGTAGWSVQVKSAASRLPNRPPRSAVRTKLQAS